MSQPGFPLVRGLECSDPLELMPALASLRHPFLLHSSLLHDRGRWSFFGAEPFESFRGRNYEIAAARWRLLSQRARLDEELSTLVPFTGGAVGYWTYDFGRRLGSLPRIAADDLHLPDFILGFYDVVGAFDHAARQCWLFSSGLPYDGGRRVEHAAGRLGYFAGLLAGRAPAPAVRILHGRDVAPRLTLDRGAYRRAVDAVQERIGRGDVSQAVLSSRWTLPLAGPGGALDVTGLTAERVTHAALALHAALAEGSAAPFAAFLAAGDHAVVSASPERLLELRGRRVETRPIWGTRARGDDPGTDQRLRAELEASKADRAAHTVTVDALRLDLGHVCESGTVRVVRQLELEPLPQVFHLVSTIEGYLAEGMDAFDLLPACFPAATATGVPRTRAMEVIEALEPVRRHIYAGSLGYVDWRGDADWNVAIRTALVTTRAVHFAAGCGITAESDPDAAYEEALLKTEGVRHALERALGVARDGLRVSA